MRSIVQQRSRKGIARTFKLGFLGLIMIIVGTGQALAQAKSCNSDLDFNIADPGPYFLGDRMRVSANIGARDIDSGNHMDIESFGFALNCHADEDFHSCTDAGNDVAFLSTPVTDCRNAEGDPATLIIPQTNIIPIRVQGPPIRTPKNSQCNVQFDISVTDLDKDQNGNVINNRIVQAMGWPIDGGDPALCDNGLTSAATSTISYEVNTCGIEVEKQVSADQQVWFDADDQANALIVTQYDTIYYRLVVNNTSSVDFIGQMHVTDPDLNVDTWVTALAAGDQVVLGDNGSGLKLDEKTCADLAMPKALEEAVPFFFTNTASVEGMCRADTHALGGVSAVGIDPAVVLCEFEPDDPPEIVVDATEMCVNDAPWVYYEFDVFGIDGYSPSDVSYQWINVDDPQNEQVVASGTFTATSGYLLWPGAVASGSAGSSPPAGATDPDWPVGVAWPGWTESPPGTWTFTDVPEVPQLALRVSINPTDEVIVTYPPATPYCVAAPKPEINVAKSVENLTTNNDGSVDVTYKVTVSNTGGQTGTYDLVDTLMINSAFTPTAIVSNVAYLAGTENDRSGNLLAPSLAAYSTGATLVTDETLDAGLNESFVFTLKFAVDLQTATPEGVNCVAEDNDGNTGLTNHVDVYVDSEVADWAEACGEISLQPSIAVLKEVLGEDGWMDANDADSAPVKNYPAGAVYRISVTNTGPVALQNVVITDDEVGLSNFSVNGGSLAAGQTVVVTEAEAGALNVQSVCSEAGNYENTVVANAVGAANSVPVTASDNAFVVCVGTPEITVKKYISIDDGATFVDGTAGPVQAPSGALYKITVENTGQVDLVDVTVDDSRIPGGPYDVGALAVDQVVTLTSGEWAELDMAQVCGSSGLIENIASAAGTSDDVLAVDVTDTDNAKLDCIGKPMIAILKEVSLDGGNTWHDADEAPYPTAVVDGVAETGMYRITVGNVGSVPLSDVVVNDSNLGIVDYEIGDLGVGASVELDSGDIPALSVSDICASRGEKANVAYAKGSSAAGVEDEASDSATVDCIGDPAIRVIKEVSKDGVIFSAVAVTALAPADAYYRFTVENIGNVDLENVVVNDPELGIVDYVPVGAGGAGSLAMGEKVVIAHANAGLNTLADLWVPTRCDAAGDFPNTVTADGKAVDSSQTVSAEDSAMFSCETPVDICSDEGAGGRPSALKLEYNGTPTGINAQGAVGTFMNGYTDYSEVATVNVSDGKSPGKDYPAVLGQLVNLDGSFTSTGGSGKIPPNIRFEFRTAGGVLVQWIEFHGSCSLPLYVYDEYAGMTIIGFTP